MNKINEECEMKTLERYDGVDPHYKCNACGHVNYEFRLPNFCPNCGKVVSNMIKDEIIKICEYVAKKENVKCEPYFSNIHYTGYKVMIEYGKDLYKFTTYKEALAFLSK